MKVTARSATADDLPVLSRLYRLLEKEMTALHPMWPLADGLSEPEEEALLAAIDDPDAELVIGEIDGTPLGFLLARVEGLLPQAAGDQVGSIRLVFTEPEAREVGIGEVMREEVLARMRRRGVTRFDAHVLPGHRVVKNFFEAGGFSARSIIMHRDDERGGRGRRPTASW